MNTRSPRSKRIAFAAALATAAAPVLLVAPANAAPTHRGHGPGGEAGLHHVATHKLAPRTHFTMQPDGSSGKTVGGEGIPNIDSVKSTIRTYYNASSDGIANKDHSPYIREMGHLLKQEGNQLKRLYRQARQDGKKPAIVFDADDTTLWTYDMEDGAMHFNYDPTLQDTWVKNEMFPATPAMPAFVKKAQDMGFTIFGVTGRSADQKPATVDNLSKYYGDAFSAKRFYTKWADGDQPSYISCATTKCSTVEFKAGTRQHIEKMGYDIALNVGDQWSDLQGGAADNYLKLPNPTYYLPSPDLPGMHEPQLAPRTHFTMKPDGSSGRTVGGEGIPNIDSVKSTIRTYYNATDGIANKEDSPYIREMDRITGVVSPLLDQACAAGARKGINPAIVLDADDTTLWTYDMEDGAMHFNFVPKIQNDDWVQPEKFPATPGMVALVNAAYHAGCTLIGLTGRSFDQKRPTIENLTKQEVGYQGFTWDNYYTKWATGEQPSYIHCKTDKCTTIEYKSQTRKHVESAAGGDYTVLANFGDQFSDLIGGYALADVKLPNPTYYLP